jgi:hypothetical protein
MRDNCPSRDFLLSNDTGPAVLWLRENQTNGPRGPANHLDAAVRDRGR